MKIYVRQKGVLEMANTGYGELGYKQEIRFCTNKR